VAIFTLLTLLALVNIAGTMAGKTVLGQIGVNVPLVACFAGHFFMLSSQGKFRVLGMIKAYFLPFPRAMTVFTFPAISTLVFIINFVTAVTLFGQLFLVQNALVTRVAFHLAVPTLQWILGILVVIEDNVFPLLFVMTIVAFFAIACPMHVIQLMA